MVSLSFPFCTAYSRQRNARAKARKAIYQGEGFPRFLASFASEPRAPPPGVNGRGAQRSKRPCHAGAYSAALRARLGRGRH
jgi:hypothetical protein